MGHRATDQIDTGYIYGDEAISLIPLSSRGTESAKDDRLIPFILLFASCRCMLLHNSMVLWEQRPTLVSNRAPITRLEEQMQSKSLHTHPRLILSKQQTQSALRD